MFNLHFLESRERFEMVRSTCLPILQQLPDGSIDSFVSDPPYGINLVLHTSRLRPRSIAGDGKLEARRLWESFVPEAKRAAKPNSAHLFFGTWKSPWMHDILAKSFDVKGAIVWDKKIIGLGHHLRPRWEMIYLCHKGKPPRLGTAEADIWPVARKMRTDHPCEKPVELMRKAVRLVAPPGSLICDPFAGIASTGVAALMEGCRFLGVEIDTRHCDLARRRLAAVAAPAS